MRFLSLLVLLFSVMVSGAQAQDEQRYTSLRLVAEHTQVNAGDVVTVAIEQTIALGWHTYWKNPGDSGAEPVFDWQLPDGFAIGPVQWQAPEKIPYGPLLNYGYSNMAVTLQDLSVPADYDGSPLEIAVNVDILVCEDVCIPEFETLILRLNDGEMADNGAYIEAARAVIAPRVDWVASYAAKDGQFLVSVELPEAMDIQEASFIPEAWGAVDNAAPVSFDVGGRTLTMMQVRGEQSLDDFDRLGFVLKLVNADGVADYDVVAAPAVAVASAVPVALDAEAGAVVAPSLLFVLFGAFLGGLILNLMPCVFPVLSIKALSLVKIADGHPAEARAHGLAYTAGVVLSFLAVAGLLMVLQLGGAQIGWGFQLQNPIVVTMLAFLLFVVGLNLSGMFELRLLGHGSGGSKADEGGVTGAFFTGVLATIVATPCTAPFMATAIGVAFTQPAFVGLSIFAVLGLGLAFPYLLLSFVPALQRWLPKPGAWMQGFQQFLAFPMFGAVAWLVWVLAQQIGHGQLFGVLLGFVAIALAIWAWPRKHFVFQMLSVLSVIVVVWGIPVAAPRVDNLMPGQVQSHAFGETYSVPVLDEYLAGDQPVFVEMTAAWCITCKLNHVAAINVAATKELFAAENVAFLIGDWTNRDSEITAYLKRFGRNGVPLYVFYPAPVDGVRADPVLLPQLLTSGIVEDYVIADYMK